MNEELIKKIAELIAELEPADCIAVNNSQPANILIGEVAENLNTGGSPQDVIDLLAVLPYAEDIEAINVVLDHLGAPLRCGDKPGSKRPGRP